MSFKIKPLTLKKKNMSKTTSLKALAEDKAYAGITKSTIFRVDPNLIEFEEGFNVRLDNEETQEHINRLYAAIKAGAFIPPVDVMLIDGKIICREGHCRTKAGQRFRKEFPEYTMEVRQLKGNDVDAVLHMLGTGGGGKPLSPLEQGIGFLRLTRLGLKPTEIAARLGISRVTVDNGLVLAEAPREVQQMISNGEVSSTTAREVLKQGTESVTALVEKVKETRQEQPKAEDQTKPEKGTATAKKTSKKKVTSKTLKGTAAEKKPQKKTPEAKAGDTSPTIPDDSILVLVKKSTAEETVKFLREWAGADEVLLEMAATIEAQLVFAL